MSTESTDEQLFRAHEAKAAHRLETTRVLLQQLRRDLRPLTVNEQRLQFSLATLEDSKAALLGQSDSDKLESGLVAQDDRDRLQILEAKLGEARALLRVCQTEKGAIQAKREALLRERVALETPLSLEAFRTSPMRRIPSKLLAEIFVFAAEDETQLVGRGILPILTQVCGRWRTAACKAPALWSTFRCELFGGTHGANLVDLYLCRSQSTPLSIDVHASGRDISQCVGVRAALARHSERLYSLRLTGEAWSAVKLHGFRGRLSRLEVLRLPDGALGGQQSSGVFEIAPLLHTLILEHSSPRERIPVPQIRVLHLRTSAGPQLYLNEFTHTSSLTCTVTDSRPDTHRPITFPSLSSWRIIFAHSNFPDNLFREYRTPALQSLEIASLTRDFDISGLIVHCGCQLTKLRLAASSIGMAEMLRVFRATPSLETLSVEDVTPSALAAPLLRALTIAPGRTPLLPRLKHISVAGRYAFRDADMGTMLESRVGTLVSVSLRLEDRRVSDVEAQRLRSLRGVRVSLECQDAERNVVAAI
ncbi:hypothetical protein C8R43DRAFT_438972 [Mycena crocata]|nr:hypothetical protein C8R43DRAFT_438972 [Mycena crocata]